MNGNFFSGSFNAKLDEKSRFVLPQSFRYQLVENGMLQFAIGLSMGGCLAIYKQSEITQIVQNFQEKKHIAKFQQFFTLFFSTLVQTTCDKVGRVTLPQVLVQTVGIEEKELIISGAMDKIEIWPKTKYEQLFSIMAMEIETFDSLMEEAFSCNQESTTNLEQIIENVSEKVKI